MRTILIALFIMTTAASAQAQVYTQFDEKRDRRARAIEQKQSRIDRQAVMMERAKRPQINVYVLRSRCRK